VEQRNQPRGWHQYFEGFRVNCESIPRLPAAAVRFAIDDPRQIPYLFVWTWMDDNAIKEAVHVVWKRQDDWIEVKRPLCWSPLQVGRQLYSASLASAGRIAAHSTLGPARFHKSCRGIECSGHRLKGFWLI
jgi:hypothetical protein